MPRAPALQDVAARADVHRSTVSPALRESPSVSPAMREKVRRIAEEPGYQWTGQLGAEAERPGILGESTARK